MLERQETPTLRRARLTRLSAEVILITDNLSLRFSVARLVYIPITLNALYDLVGRPLLTHPERKKTHDGLIYDIRHFFMPREIYEN